MQHRHVFISYQLIEVQASFQNFVTKIALSQMSKLAPTYCTCKYSSNEMQVMH